jgi:hypothetical protein
LRERTLAKMEGHKPMPLPSHVLREMQSVLGEAALEASGIGD